MKNWESSIFKFSSFKFLTLLISILCNIILIWAPIEYKVSSIRRDTFNLAKSFYQIRNINSWTQYSSLRKYIIFWFWQIHTNNIMICLKTYFLRFRFIFLINQTFWLFTWFNLRIKIFSIWLISKQIYFLFM